jgi:Spy/CpxP family protein refolding chaperone
MGLRLAALTFVAGALVAAPAWTQGKTSDVTDMQALQAAVRADKRGYVASTLALTDAEAKKFWPIYDAYQRSLETANRQRSVALVSVVGQGQTIGDLRAKNVLKELVAADDVELKARRTMRDRVLGALPADKAIRYLQLEYKIRAAQDYDLATTIPMIRQ